MRWILQISSERTGTDFSAVKHQSHQPSSSIFSSEARDEFCRFLQNTLSPTFMDLALVSVVRAVDGQETGLSVQPAEKMNRLQTGQEYHLQSALAQASLLLKQQPAGQLKERDLWRHIQSANRVSSRNWSRVFTDQSRSLSRDSPNKKVGSTFFALTSTVIPVFSSCNPPPAYWYRLLCYRHQSTSKLTFTGI